MVTWAEVTRWDSAPLQGAVGEVNAAYNKVVACSDDLRGINTADGWHGEAAGAAANEVNQVIDGLEEYAAEVASLRRSAGDVGDAISGVMNGVKEVEGLARAHHFTIGGDGAVNDNGPPPDTPEDQKEAVARERATIAAELRDRVSEVLKSATDIDDDFCLVLDRIVSGQTIDATGNDNENTSLAAAGNSGAAMGSLSIPAPPPEGATPAQNAAYWATLSEAQRTRLATDRPELVGPRDGFSAKQRDTANRIIFEQQRADLQQQRAELQRKINEFPRNGAGEIKLNDQREFDALKSQLRDTDKRINGMNALGDRLNQPDDTPDDQKNYLLGIDSSGDGKAILAKGNPDTSENVATYVPGTTADLPTFGDEAGRAEAMQRAAAMSGSPSTSVITWLGYDAPDAIPNAISEDYANAAVKPLDNFQDGLRESHKGLPSHNTIVGHSYGSTVIGYAARGGNELAVDEFIAVGSPGVGVYDAKNLGVPHGHVWATAAENDPVPITGAFTGNPTDPGFNGNVFKANPGDSSLVGYNVNAHSQYWDPNNPALVNMGDIIAGHQPTVR
ncbi:alpha/beta hydrolase [Amycolatopsis sp. cmx-11-51]|uniref:alpha/beta hydrolase n=1 Tax=Amycolatopsis sp. cmx-11-51 TaxID=2785797 RepID=UPI0039E2DAE7